jgi:hypothetical protein
VFTFLNSKLEDKRPFSSLLGFCRILTKQKFIKRNPSAKRPGKTDYVITACLSHADRLLACVRVRVCVCVYTLNTFAFPLQLTAEKTVIVRDSTPFPPFLYTSYATLHTERPANAEQAVGMYTAKDRF